jgi:hypothetical protein
MPDCSTPFYNTHPSIVINEADTFFGFGDIAVDTNNPVEGHEPATFCVYALYNGWVGNDGEGTYSPSFRICEDYLTRDINKPFFFENAYAYNDGVKYVYNMHTLGF